MYLWLEEQGLVSEAKKKPEEKKINAQVICPLIQDLKVLQRKQAKKDMSCLFFR